MQSYAALLRVRAFRWFWSGFTLSSLGDAMTQVALTWYVLETTGSPEMLGAFVLASTAPVLVGGLAAGWLLDRFERRRVMLLDSLFRGGLVALVPVLHAVGALALWHVFVVGAAYGLLKMIPLAGGPSLVPALVPARLLTTANALEMLAWTLSGVVGPALAGVLIPVIGAPNVLSLDALSYLAFAVTLTRVPRLPRPTAAGGPGATLADAVRLVARAPVLLATTLMFMAFNVGLGLALVWLPVLVRDVLAAGPTTYGVLLGVLALGEVAGSVAAGGIIARLALGTLIGLAQIASGIALGVIALRTDVVVAALCLFAFGLASAPLTVWAQTLRMRVIPDVLRGRTFALLRTLMQGTLPVGGGLAGLLLPLLGTPALIVLSGVVVAVPGAVGLLVRPLRGAGRADIAAETA